MPYSVTMQSTSFLLVLICAPGVSVGIIRLTDLVLGRGGKGNEALAALGLHSTPDIITLAAGTGDMTGTDGLGTDLAEEVHLQRGIDGDEIGMLGNDRRVIHIVDRQHFHHGVIINVIIHSLRAQCKGGHRLAV